MSESFEELPDDPALREAIRRACGRERAPEHLRQSIVALMAQPASALPQPDAGAARPAAPATAQASRRALRASSLFSIRSLAAAAVVLIAIGVIAVEVRNEFFPAATTSVASVPHVMQFPMSFAIEMVRTHENCAKLPDHHLAAAGSDFDALRDSLSKEEGIKVFAAALGDDWQFKGAGICRIGDKPAAHLLFARGDERVSVFSMPYSPDYGDEGGSYAETVDHAAITGFANAGALYCVVGNKSTGGDMAMKEVKPLLAKVRSSLGCPPGSGACQYQDAVASRI